MTKTYGDIGQRAAAFASADMLRRAEPWLKLEIFSRPMIEALPWWKRWLVKLGFMRPPPLPGPKIKPIPEGETVKFRRPVPFEARRPHMTDQPEIETLTDNRRATALQLANSATYYQTPEDIVHRAKVFLDFLESGDAAAEPEKQTGTGDGSTEDMTASAAAFGSALGTASGAVSCTGTGTGDSPSEIAAGFETGETNTGVVSTANPFGDEFVRDQPAIDTSGFKPTDGQGTFSDEKDQ